MLGTWTRNPAVIKDPYLPAMEWLVRLRIALADEPGALARVASLIAGAGGNIISVDVHRAASPDVVDDVVVAFRDRSGLAGFREAMERHGAGTLLSHQDAYRADPVVAALNGAAGMLAAPSGMDDPLIRGVAELAASPAVWLAPVEDAGQWEAGRLALDRGATVTRAHDLPDEMAARLPGESWLLAVPLPDALRVLFVARLQSNPFTNTELARIEALLALYAAAQGR